MLSFVVPTRDRPLRLQRTLEALAALDAAALDRDGAEVIVIDNASEATVSCPRVLPNGLRVRTHRTEENLGAAGRNVAAALAAGDWLVMLDDDSHPVDARFVELLDRVPADIAAIGAEIILSDGRHEAGGLPEVFVGCGVAIRRDAFLEAGGYDPSFHYYVEEYDLCARLLARGWRVIHDRRFRVAHEKVVDGRDMNLILHRLVRNNGWTARRYAPEPEAEIDELVARYGRIARKEHAVAGYEAGLAELRSTLDAQPRTPLTPETYERFRGLHHAREHLGRSDLAGHDVAIVAAGKHEHLVRQALLEFGARIVASRDEADVLVIGTLSPGPLLDGMADWTPRTALPVVPPWQWHGGRIGSEADLPSAPAHHG